MGDFEEPRTQSELFDAEHEVMVGNLRVIRSLRFLRQIMFGLISAVALAIASIFSEQVADFFNTITPFVGFVYAELSRRATVNPETWDGRPYSWRELYRRIRSIG